MDYITHFTKKPRIGYRELPEAVQLLGEVRASKFPLLPPYHATSRSAQEGELQEHIVDSAKGAGQRGLGLGRGLLLAWKDM